MEFLRLVRRSLRLGEPPRRNALSGFGDFSTQCGGVMYHSGEPITSRNALSGFGDFSTGTVSSATF